MKFKEILGATLLSTLLAMPAIAATDGSLEWSAPTARINGDVLESSEIDYYNIYCGIGSGSYAGVTPVVVDSTAATNYTVPISSVVGSPLPEGHHFCALQAVDIYGLRSDLTNPADFVVETGGNVDYNKLLAPGNFRFVPGL